MCDFGTAISAGISLVGLMQDDDRNDAAQSTQLAAVRAAQSGADIQARQFAIEEPFRRRQVSAGISAIGRGEQLAEAELPLQLRVIDEAAAAGTPAEQDVAAARAVSDAQAAISATGDTRVRTLRSLGINPGSPAALAGNRAAQAADAATLAKASTDAREAEFRRGQEQRIRVAGQARGFNPNVSTVTDPGASLVRSGASMVDSAASLSRINTAEQQRREEQLRTIGQAAGTAATRYLTPQDTPAPTYYRSSTPYVDSGFADFEKGGAVNGPSHDAGGVPIEVEGGEYVIKAESTRKYGPRLLREVNEGTALIIPMGSPRRLKSVA